MSVALSIQDQTSSGEVLSNNVLTFPVDNITVRQLIETRVQQEIDKLDVPPKMLMGDIELTSFEQSLKNLTPRQTRQRAKMNVQEQQRIAIDSFENNGFFILFNDKQLCDLDDLVHITPNSNVTFFKLTPVVGG